MVELPNHEHEPSARSAASERLRQWFERDINETRPFSLALAIVPILPAIVASEVGVEQLSSALLMLGSPFAVGWFFYVMYRQFRVSARDMGRLFTDREARKRGEELPTRCPECGIDLPKFQPPNDGKVYRFQGWNCENCGAMLDELGHVI